MKNKSNNAEWVEPPTIYPNPLLDSFDNPNIKMAATMLAMACREHQAGIIIDILSGIAQEIETHWNAWNYDNNIELDIRRLRSPEDQFRLQIRHERKTNVYPVDHFSNVKTAMAY